MPGACQPTSCLRRQPESFRPFQKILHHKDLTLRSPVWMLAYALALVLLGATYAALVFLGSEAALIFALMALVAVVTAVVLVLKR